MRKYKKIEIGPRAEFTEDETAQAEAFLSVLPDDDLYADFDNDSLTLHLREIDFGTLSKLGELAENRRENRLWQTLFSKIDRIKSYGIRGGKRVYVDYNAERKVKNRLDKERQRNAIFYTQGNGFSEKNQELPARFRNKIICGDSETVLKELPDNCVDLVLTSPPYNFGLEYSESADASQWEAYFKKLFAVLDECVRVLKYGGRIIINVQPLFSDYIPTHHLISHHLMSRKLIWKGEILWEKNNYNCKYTAWGSWKSPSNPYLKYTWEFLEIFCKGSLKKEGRAEDADIAADEFKKWVVAEWSIAPERRMAEYGHPAMFPEELACRAIKLFSFRGDAVLDPFNGAGTTTGVARRLERPYLGIDISKEYCQMAEQRLQSPAPREILLETE